MKETTEESQEKESAEEAHAYTPGLKIKKGITITKTRVLPIPGDVLVEKGDIVDFDTIVARTDIPGNPVVLRISDVLNVKPEMLDSFMVKKVGDYVEEGEIIAKYEPFWGLIKRFARSPAKGSIEAFSDFTGQVVIREPPIPVEIKSYISGKVIEILPKGGVVIENNVALIQGIFGIGGEMHGELSIVVESPDEIITADKIEPEHKGKIIVGGSLVTLEAFRKAKELGVYGIIVGGIIGLDLTECIGYEIGVAITGQEDIGITLIITEGFGRMSMSTRTFNLLKELEGYEAAINGATQIRAGVIRPEVIIPHKKYTSESVEGELIKGMRSGTPVRIIREPYFGSIGTVESLPINLQKIDTESPVRVLEVRLKEGNVIVPRANVEIIEE